MSFTWDSAEYQYRDYLGRLVPKQTVRAVLDEVIDDVADAIEADSRQLANEPPPEEEDDDKFAWWLSGMETHIKTANVIAAALAVGGIARMTDEARGTTTDRILTQYEFLRGFVDEIRGGLPLDETFVGRSRMYGLSGTGTYEAIHRQGMKATGYTEERRHLASTRPCASCIGYAAQGWVPIGTLPGIGDACECHSNCRCSFEYRIRR